jgi:hypothetical protein
MLSNRCDLAIFNGKITDAIDMVFRIDDMSSLKEQIVWQGIGGKNIPSPLGHSKRGAEQEYGKWQISDSFHLNPVAVKVIGNLLFAEEKFDR